VMLRSVPLTLSRIVSLTIASVGGLE